MADPLRLVDDYPLYIGGDWIEPRSGRYDDVSPATEETIAQAPNADLDDVDAAIGAARLHPGRTFGGFKQSGLGREGGGLPGLHRYMEPKAIGIPV